VRFPRRSTWIPVTALWILIGLWVLSPEGFDAVAFVRLHPRVVVLLGVSCIAGGVLYARLSGRRRRGARLGFVCLWASANTMVCLFLASELARMAPEIARDILTRGKRWESIQLYSALLLTACAIGYFLWRVWYGLGYRRVVTAPDRPQEPLAEAADPPEETG
jgi:hypothetical protein